MKKLSEIQQKLKAPKKQYNSFGKYRFRNQEDILEAVKPLLGEATIIVSDELVMLGDRFYIKAVATFKDKEEIATATAYAREPIAKKGMDESQITGASSSYARKYALNGLLLIDDTKDADTTDNTETVEAAIKKLTEIKDIDTLRDFYKKNEGLGKEFASAVTARKKEIEESDIPVIQV